MTDTQARWAQAFGRVLTERMNALGLSTYKFAVIAETSRGNVTEYRAGRTMPMLYKLSDIALALEMDLSEFVQLIEAEALSEDLAAAG